jgi:hypothetical protein
MKGQMYKEQTLAKDCYVHRIHIIIDPNIIPQGTKKNGRLKEEILSIKQSP